MQCFRTIENKRNGTYQSFEISDTAHKNSLEIQTYYSSVGRMPKICEYIGIENKFTSVQNNSVFMSLSLNGW